MNDECGRKKDKDEDGLWYFQLPHEKIVELIHILEGYEGFAAPRVLDKERGIVELLVAPDLARELEAVIADLASCFPIARIPRPERVKTIADDE
ncbi:MAG TPA: DUF4911 domain-containing protein [bacterium]|nr:DUF4911 domain-containing protein [bacterium]